MLSGNRLTSLTRTVKTASGATAVQAVYASRRESAHDDTELEVLKAVARQRLAAGPASPRS
jgi:hypothetical protein